VWCAPMLTRAARNAPALQRRYGPLGGGLGFTPGRGGCGGGQSTHPFRLCSHALRSLARQERVYILKNRSTFVAPGCRPESLVAAGWWDTWPFPNFDIYYTSIPLALMPVIKKLRTTSPALTPSAWACDNIAARTLPGTTTCMLCISSLDRIVVGKQADNKGVCGEACLNC
jgi:hypothetical protein